jgi:hypothetical protein
MAEAMGAADFPTLAALVAPDAVLRSPITDAVEVRGRDRIVALLRIVRDAYEELEYTDLFAAGDVGVQAFRARVDGRAMEGLDLMRFDGEGHVRELTVYFRPLPGLATLTAALAPRLAAGRGRAAARAVRVGTRLLVSLARAGDRVAPALLRSLRGA